MATYGYSTPYTGQRQPTLPPGYMEAATAPGRNIAAGIQQFAAGLGQAIEKYRANKAETEAATQTYETLVGMTNQALASDPQYQALQQYYETGQLPAGVTEADLGRFANKVQADRTMLNKMMGIGDKFGDMSLAKKKAAIGDMAMVLGQYQQRTEGDLKRRQLEMTVRDLERKEKAAADIENLTRYAAGLPSTRTVQEQVPVELQPIGPMPADQAAAPIPVSAGGTGEWPAGLPPVSSGPVRRQYAPAQPAQGLMNTGIPVGGAMQFAQRAPAQMGRVAPQAPDQGQFRTPAPSPTDISLPSPVTVQEQVQRTEQIPYSEIRSGLAQFAASQRMAPEAFQAIDKVLEVASGMRKPVEVDQQVLPGGAQVIRADGKIEVLPPPKPVEGKDLTEFQAASAGYAARMAYNDKVLNQIAYTPGSITEFGFMPERLKSENRKAYEAAKTNWIAAKLRKESGAAIGEKEYSDADMQYFPQAGDSKKVINQKQQLRKLVEREMKTAIGKNGDFYINQILGSASEQPSQQPVETRRTTSGTTYQIQKY